MTDVEAKKSCSPHSKHKYHCLNLIQNSKHKCLCLNLIHNSKHKYHCLNLIHNSKHKCLSKFYTYSATRIADTIVEGP